MYIQIISLGNFKNQKKVAHIDIHLHGQHTSTEYTVSTAEMKNNFMQKEKNKNWNLEERKKTVIQPECQDFNHLW